MITETIDTGILWPGTSDNSRQALCLTLWSPEGGDPAEVGIITAYERIWIHLKDVPRLIQCLQTLYDKYANPPPIGPVDGTPSVPG